MMKTIVQIRSCQCVDVAMLDGRVFIATKRSNCIEIVRIFFKYICWYEKELKSIVVALSVVVSVLEKLKRIWNEKALHLI